MTPDHPENDGNKPWWVIHDSELLIALDRVAAGEPPALVHADLLAGIEQREDFRDDYMGDDGIG